MKTCFSSKHLFPTDVAKGEFENTCSVKPRKQNLSFIISRSNVFVADRFQNLHEEERARECSSKGKRERRVYLWSSRLILVLLANIAFGTKKEDLFWADITRWEFYQITPPERKKEIGCWIFISNDHPQWNNTNTVTEEQQQWSSGSSPLKEKTKCYVSSRRRRREAKASIQATQEKSSNTNLCWISCAIRQRRAGDGVL